MRLGGDAPNFVLQLCFPGFRVRRALSLSYLNVLPRLETVVQVPIMEGVPHLIENDSRIACHSVDVGMRMSIDPSIYPAVSNELCGIIQFSMSRRISSREPQKS